MILPLHTPGLTALISDVERAHEVPACIDRRFLDCASNYGVKFLRLAVLEPLIQIALFSACGPRDAVIIRSALIDSAGEPGAAITVGTRSLRDQSLTE